MAKTIRDTILAYPGLADCEDFLDNVVLPGRGFEGTEDSKTSALSRIPVHGMTLRRNDYTGREENRRKRN